MILFLNFIKMKSNNFLLGFDLDGVIVNSLSVMEKSWEKVCKKNNINIPFERYQKNIGLKFNVILKNIGVEKSLHKKINQDYFKLTKKYQSDIQLYPNVKETFNRLKEKNIPTFIVTSKPRENTLYLLKMFNIKVDLLICADDVTLGKPHNEAGLIVRKKFRIDKIFYVGDMDSDFKFAENCSFNFIYAKYGYGILNKKPTLKIDSISEVLELEILFS